MEIAIVLMKLWDPKTELFHSYCDHKLYISSSFFTFIIWIDSDVFTNAFCVWWICSSVCQSWKRKSEDQQISVFSVSVNSYTVLPFIAPSWWIWGPICFKCFVSACLSPRSKAKISIWHFEWLPVQVLLPSLLPFGSNDVILTYCRSMGSFTGIMLDISAQFVLNAF